MGDNEPEAVPDRLMRYGDLKYKRRERQQQTVKEQEVYDFKPTINERSKSLAVNKRNRLMGGSMAAAPQDTQGPHTREARDLKKIDEVDNSRLEAY